MEDEKEFLQWEIDRLEKLLYLYDAHGYINDFIKIENISPRIDILKSILEFVEKWENK